MPANWGPKAAARMKLDKHTELDPKREPKKGQKRNADSGQPSKRARIRENKRLKRLEKRKETDAGIDNEK